MTGSIKEDGSQLPEGTSGREALALGFSVQIQMGIQFGRKFSFSVSVEGA